MSAPAVAPNLALYRSFSRLPLGQALFSRALCVKAPYFTMWVSPKKS